MPVPCALIQGGLFAPRVPVTDPWKGMIMRTKRLIPVVLATTLGLTLTANGASVLGLAVLSAGAAAALYESRPEWNS